jgi:cation diffusion facilitator CzcD-associated flavoprotein CzcO
MLDTVIVGAGPYGLSLGAHLRSAGVSFRIFGRTMGSWRDHMPKGMMLKSDGFASNIYTPDGTLTIQQFCAESGIPYHHTEIPVSLATFSEYGVAFRNRLLPELEEKNVIGIVHNPQGFVLTLDTGEEVRAQRVVLAVGITHFTHIPEPFSQLGPAHVTHSYQHHDLEPFRGRDVVVVGGGASAIELSGLLHEAGANVQLVARRRELVFHNPPPIGGKRSLWQRIRNPQSGLGPGLKSRFFANSPEIFRHLPEAKRLEFVRTALGPSAGWTSKKQVMGKVPLLLGMTPLSADVVDGKVRLHLRAADGSERDVITDHIITGTGYKVDLNRLQFLSSEIRQQVAVVNGSPALSGTFESSVPGLYFIGLAAANTFGPVMRFAFGGGFAARRVASALKASRSRLPAIAPAVHAVSAAKNESSSAL